MTGPDILDAVLNYESECYEQGYAEGRAEGVSKGHIEGRELGIQTGFQRFKSLGVIQGRIQMWEESGLGNTEGGDRDAAEGLGTATANAKAAKAAKLLTQLKRDYIDEAPDCSNDPAAVEKLDQLIRKAKTKCRSMANATNTPPVNLYETRLMPSDSAIEDL